MGRFELTDAQREAIAVFILAQVEKSPSAKYVYHPDPRRKAVIEGRRVIDKYACTECHTLELERWTLRRVRQGRDRAADKLSGMPRLDRQGALLEDEDDDGKPQHYFTLWSPTVIDGRALAGRRRGCAGDREEVWRFGRRGAGLWPDCSIRLCWPMHVRTD